ncbi:integrase [Nocardioides immobilis]|uniref:Integrase n=1 Tax=Nocardioides immobilis TaxID=2049295 RepID=A0A417XSN0_9ACTN|nr:tyrosine-type recombinase/integrase [Nocardioides immobilis]RHW23247.1 integrase [Nocardioides immobilis]
MSAYVEHCQRLGCGDRALRDRLRSARGFLAVHPDPWVWMDQPATSRVTELRRTRAWPLLVFLIGTGRLRLDLELAAAKNLTGLGAIVEARHAEDFAAARAAGHRLGWTAAWVETVLGDCLAVLLAWHGGAVADLNQQVFAEFDEQLGQTMQLSRSSLRAYRARLASLRQLMFEIGVHDAPPRRRPWSRTLEQRFAEVAMAEAIRTVMLRYVQTRASVLRPRSVESLVNDLLPFAEFLTAQHPEVTTLRDLERHHVEEFLIWNRTRSWRGRKARPQPVSPAVTQAAVLSLRNLLEDIAAWGWAEAPASRLVFAADVPKLDRALPRALAPDVDARLMAAVADLPDRFARTGLQVLRGSGLRVGELLDLEIDAVIDYGPAGTWLRVPLGKLATERSVPLDEETLAALDQWAHHRGVHRPIPHPRTGRPTDFLFTEHGRRLGATRLRNGLLAAAAAAGLCGPDGTPLTITPHQLRHTYATALANAGMSLQALMALLGHVTPEMTIRYATLASPTLRGAYDEAMGKMRRQLTLTPVGRPIVPDKISWLASEMLKTRVAHGYCSRHESQGPCPYANICETCDNYTPAVEFEPALTDQLADIRALQTDAEERGWTAEQERHRHVATALEGHLHNIRPR